MRLTKKQRIEIILMAGSGSSRMVALNFNKKHGRNITHDNVAKLISKLKKTGFWISSFSVCLDWSAWSCGVASQISPPLISIFGGT